jgi:hypothetical protein
LRKVLSQWAGYHQGWIPVMRITVFVPQMNCAASASLPGMTRMLSDMTVLAAALVRLKQPIDSPWA